MPNTHNLTTDERRALLSGAVVSWRGCYALAEQVGTVDMIGSAGGLILCDGTRVAPDDFCRLMRATPTPIRECAEGTRPRCSEAADDPENSLMGWQDATDNCVGYAEPPAIAPLLPQDAPEGAEPPKTPPEQKPPAPGQGLPRKSCKGSHLKDHALWLRAVQAILDRMAAGARRLDAVAAVAAMPEFASLKVTRYNYPWWARKFRVEGHTLRSFAGGTNLPKSKAAKAAAGIGCQQCLHLQSQLNAERAPHDVLRDQAIRERDAERAAVTRLSTDLLSARTELASVRAELGQANRERSKLVAIYDQREYDLNVAHVAVKAAQEERDELARRPAGIPPPPLGKGAHVSCAWEFALPNLGGAGSIFFVTEGTGHYVELNLTEALQLDPAEFVALAEWADKACRVMDRASGEEE